MTFFHGSGMHVLKVLVGTRGEKFCQDLTVIEGRKEGIRDSPFATIAMQIRFVSTPARNTAQLHFVGAPL